VPHCVAQTFGAPRMNKRKPFLAGNENPDDMDRVLPVFAAELNRALSIAFPNAGSAEEARNATTVSKRASGIQACISNGTHFH